MKIGEAVFPGFWYDLLDLVSGHVRQAGEHVAQVIKWIFAPPPTAFDDGVDNSAALTGVDLSNKQPVLFANGGRTNGVFDLVGVDFDSTIAQEDLQG